jgi:hypothetical protein
MKIKEMLIAASMFSGMFEANQSEWKDRILKQWEESKNFPRKKKKQVRKSLKLDWSIACYNPFS